METNNLIIRNVNIASTKNAIDDVRNSSISLDDKIVALTAIKAELLIYLKNKGHRFTSKN